MPNTAATISLPKTLLNPSIVVEVLSKSTMRYDLAVKVPRYKTLPAVQHILLVNQQTPRRLAVLPYQQARPEVERGRTGC